MTPRAGLLALVLLSIPAPAAAEVRGVAAVEVGLSLAEPSAVVGIEGGLRVDHQWTFLLEVDWNPWFAIGAPDPAEGGVLNVGVGVEHVFAEGLLRAALFAGSSTLLFDTALDQGGTTGMFLELVPLSVRVPLIDDVMTMRIDPISAHLIVPVLTGIPLVRYEFRHAVSFEVTP